MYYKLNDRYALRGYEKLPHALSDLCTGITQFLDPLRFEALSFCNGMLDTESAYILPVHRKMITEFLDYGIIAECGKSGGLKPYQRYRLAPCRYIKEALWSITGKCNLKCRHCYMSAPDAKYGELSTAECLDIIGQLADANIAMVSLTGGEPLIRGDFFALIDALIQKGIVVSQIYTNGVLINEALLDKFTERGMRPEFSLSFDGIGQHDWLRGMDGAEALTIRKIQLLVQKGFRVGIEISVHKKNAGTLFESILLLTRLGVSSIKVSPTSDTGNWLIQNNTQYTLSPKELFDIYLDTIKRYREEHAPVTLHLSGVFSCKKNQTNYTVPGKRFDGTGKMLQMPVCGCARTTMYIAADATLLPCIPLSGMKLAKDFPKITEVPLAEALSDSDYMNIIDIRLSDLLDENGQCAACAHNMTCGGGCRAGALICGHGYLGPDDYSCYFFKNDYEQKLYEIWNGGKSNVLQDK